jgi:hypothetical protein
MTKIMQAEQLAGTAKITPIRIDGKRADQLMSLSALHGQVSDFYFAMTMGVIFIALLSDQLQNEFLFWSLKGLCLAALLSFFIKHYVGFKKDAILRIAINEANPKLS